MKKINQFNLIGKKWGELSQEDKDILLNSCHCINGVDGSGIEEGVCIVDLRPYVAIEGKIIEGEVVIDNNSEMYQVGEVNYWKYGLSYKEMVEYIKEHTTYTYNIEKIISDTIINMGTRGQERVMLDLGEKFEIIQDYDISGDETIIYKYDVEIIC